MCVCVYVCVCAANGLRLGSYATSTGSRVGAMWEWENGCEINLVGCRGVCVPPGVTEERDAGYIVCVLLP